MDFTGVKQTHSSETMGVARTSFVMLLPNSGRLSSMAVLIVLLVSLLLARLAGAEGVAFLNSWPAATRMGLGVMLLFTSSAHFTSMRQDLARMMPPAVPHPMLVVYFTGLCEILGAIGLQLPFTRVAAAIALILFFLA